MAFEAFISYSTRDLVVARQVKELLERPGCSAFLAEYSVAAGDPLDETITAAIERCDVFILLWSQNAKDSEWVPQEIGIAKAQKKPIIPVSLHKDAVPSGFLKGTKYLPLYKNPATSLKWLQDNVFERATKKEKSQGLAWLALGATVIWLLNRDGGGA